MMGRGALVRRETKFVGEEKKVGGFNWGESELEGGGREGGREEGGGWMDRGGNEGGKKGVPARRC